MDFGVAFKDGQVFYFRPNWAKSIPCFLACSSKFQVWRRIANIVPAWWNCNLCRFPLPSEWPKLAFKLDTRVPLMWRPKYIVHAKRAYCRFVFKKISFTRFNFLAEKGNYCLRQHHLTLLPLEIEIHHQEWLAIGHYQKQVANLPGLSVRLALRVITRSVFIGPESDHWQCLSVTHSLTD